MIEIDEINRKYLAYMRVLNEKNNILLEWQKEIDNLAEDYKTEEIKEIKEGRSGNIEEEKKARRKLEEMKDKAAQIEKKAIAEAEEMREVLQKVDGLLEEMLEDNELRNIILQELEKQYILKIEELTKRKNKVDKENINIERVTKVLQENPMIITDMQNAVESTTELKRINYVIYNLENNGMLSKKEESNKKLLEKSREKKRKHEERKMSSYINMKSILNASDYGIIEAKINEMIENSVNEGVKIDVKRKIKRQATELRQQKSSLEESIENNKRELKLLEKRAKTRGLKKRVKTNSKQQEDKRREFLDRIGGYEIAREGIHKIKNELREERKKQDMQR